MEQSMEKQKNDNLSLLNAVARNSGSGKDALQQLAPMAEEGLFKAEILREINEFRQINQEAHTCIAACGAQTKEASALSKAGMKMGIGMKTLTDSSTRALAEMVLEGAQQGVVDCVESLRDYPQATPGAKHLTQRLQDFEEDCIQKMQQFL